MATSVAAVEAVVLVLLGLVEIVTAHGERLALGVTTTMFFFLYGGFLAYAAWRLYRLQSWARAPIVLAQLIQMLVGASFWDRFPAVTVAAVLLGLLTLAGVFHPASLTALEGEESR